MSEEMQPDARHPSKKASAGKLMQSDLAWNERSSVDGLALCEEVRMFATCCLRRVQELQSCGLRHGAEADEDVLLSAL